MSQIISKQVKESFDAMECSLLECEVDTMHSIVNCKELMATKVKEFFMPRRKLFHSIKNAQEANKYLYDMCCKELRPILRETFYRFYDRTISRVWLCVLRDYDPSNSEKQRQLKNLCVYPTVINCYIIWNKEGFCYNKTADDFNKSIKKGAKLQIELLLRIFKDKVVLNI